MWRVAQVVVALSVALAVSCKRSDAPRAVKDEPSKPTTDRPLRTFELAEAAWLAADDDLVVVATKGAVEVFERPRGWGRQTIALADAIGVDAAGKLVAVQLYATSVGADTWPVELWHVKDGRVGRRMVGVQDGVHLTTAGLVVISCSGATYARRCGSELWDGQTTVRLPYNVAKGGALKGTRDGLSFLGSSSTTFMEVPSAKLETLFVPGGSDLLMYARGELGAVIDATSTDLPNVPRTLWLVPNAPSASPQRLVDLDRFENLVLEASSRLIVLVSLKDNVAHALDLATRHWTRFDYPTDTLSLKVTGLEVAVLTKNRLVIAPPTALPGAHAEEAPRLTQ